MKSFGSLVRIAAIAAALAAPATAELAGPARAADEGPEPGFQAGQKIPLSAALSLPESAADSATIYRNEGGSVFNSSILPATVLEDLTLLPNAAPLEIRSIEFAYTVAASATNVVLRIDVKFWDVFDAALSPVHSGLLGTSSYAPNGTSVHPTGGWLFGPADLAAAVVPADTNVAIQFDFRNLNTGALLPNGQVSAFFAGGGVTTGSSADRFFRDADLNGRFDPGDARSFGGAPNLANFYLHLRGAPDPSVVEAGMDLYETPAGGGTFLTIPLFAGTFDLDSSLNSLVPPSSACDPSSGACSLEFLGSVAYHGEPLSTVPGGLLGTTDTIVKRGAPASLPSAGSSATVPLEIVALSLVSVQPVTILYDDGAGGSVPTRWDVKVCLSDAAQTLGSMTITRGACAGEGGSFAATLPVKVKLTFTRIQPPDGAVVVYDVGVNGLPPVSLALAGGYWLPGAPPSSGLVEDPLGGLGVDGNCNGTTDPNALPATSPFKPGMRVVRCPGDATCDPVAPVRRQLVFRESGASALAVLPAAAPGPDADVDSIPDDADNCVAVLNSRQDDGDHDGVGDACDDCASVCDPGQADSDTDGRGDACDCAPSDPADPVPGLVSGVLYSLPPPDESTLGWTGVPSATGYDVVRGLVSALPVGPGGGDEGCSGGVPSAAFTDPATPPAGDGFYYLIRARNACGGGGYGVGGTNGAAGPVRSTTTCP